MNALLSKLKLIDQRKDATAPTYNEFDFSAAFDTLTVPANTSGSSILESSTPLLAIYFGAQWCPPCRAFSPKLSQFAKDNASQISVILCSADHSHVQAQQFARGKSFLVIPWSDTARSELQSYFKITSFPTLIVLDTRKQSCQVITRRWRCSLCTLLFIVVPRLTFMFVSFYRMGTIGNFYGKRTGTIGAALAIKPGRSVSPSLLLLHWGSIGICHRTHVL